MILRRRFHLSPPNKIFFRLILLRYATEYAVPCKTYTWVLRIARERMARGMARRASPVLQGPTSVTLKKVKTSLLNSCEGTHGAMQITVPPSL